MILELASFLGTSVGGSILGAVRDHFSSNKQAEREKKEDEHNRYMAGQKNAKEYFESLNRSDSSGNYSPLQYVIAFVVLWFSVTYGFATLSCFLWEPNSMVWTKDPSQDGREVSLFFGAIRYDLANLKVISMSKSGLGYIMLHPIIFVLSQIITGETLKRR